MHLSVVIPAHNPHLGRLQRVLQGLAAQTLDRSQWELVVVDNASAHFPPPSFFSVHSLPQWRIVQEPNLGLTAARCRGFEAAQGEVIVLVDDDNVLDQHYLAQVLRHFAELPKLGAIGGICAPEFERPPEPWQEEFFGLLALRDLGASPLIASTLRPSGSRRNEYPAFAPVGAGMAIRREAALRWCQAASPSTLSDRRGNELSSGGDNDIVFTLMAAGWHVGYFPDLKLVHLIPAGRLAPAYLARINRGIQKSWMQVLTRHQANPWSTISATSAYFRRLKAWFTYRAWSSPAAQIRWQGVRGHFEGRISQ